MGRVWASFFDPSRILGQARAANFVHAAADNSKKTPQLCAAHKLQKAHPIKEAYK
jgi:hypothetical protein